MLDGLPVRLIMLDRFPGIPPVREDGATFQTNAVKKAVQTSRHTILPVLAEDSGLEVRALQGRPGVHSARFAGKTQDDRANVEKLLRVMARVPAGRRHARFVCVMAMAAGGRLIQTFQGTCRGSIGFSSAGKRGFGYDPVFIPFGFRRKTSAQLSAEQKDRLSHRGKAARALARWLRRSF